MNLILIKAEEVASDQTVTLDERHSSHVLKTLGAAPGTRLKVGLVNGAKGSGTVIHCSGNRVTMTLQLPEESPPEPPFDLILALPRPIMLKRILFHASSLGIARIYLIRSRRVEKSYFQASLLQPAEYLPVLEAGMEQAADTWRPTVRIFPRFLPFAEDFLGTARPEENTRLLADPEARGSLASINGLGKGRTQFAVGPEGGWIDFERDILEKKGFIPFSLGGRILRVETAIPVIIGQLMLLRRQNQSAAD